MKLNFQKVKTQRLPSQRAILCVTLSLILSPLSPVSASRNGLPVDGKFPAVSMISGADGHGTGVLISPDLVLTVNHVPGETNLNFVQIFFGYSFSRMNTVHRIADKRVLSVDSRAELTLLKLKAPVSMKPYELFISPIDAKHKVFGVGYGITGQDSYSHPSLLRADMKFEGYFQIPEDGNKDGVPVTEPDQSDVLGQLSAGDKCQISCSGDSGGPVFTSIGNDIKVVGIISSLLADDHDGTDVGYCLKAHTVRFIPLTQHIDWIRKAAKEMNANVSF